MLDSEENCRKNIIEAKGLAVAGFGLLFLTFLWGFLFRVSDLALWAIGFSVFFVVSGFLFYLDNKRKLRRCMEKN